MHVRRAKTRILRAMTKPAAGLQGRLVVERQKWTQLPDNESSPGCQTLERHAGDDSVQQLDAGETIEAEKRTNEAGNLHDSARLEFALYAHAA